MNANSICRLGIGTAVAALLLAQPVVAQTDHSSMPGMTMPAPATTPPAATPPAPAQVRSPPPAAEMPGMPGMTTPAPAVPRPGAPAPDPATRPASAPAPSAPVFPPLVPPVPVDTTGWPSPVADNAFKSFLLFDILEFQHAPNLEGARWDVLGWYGGDTERVWFKSEGRYNGISRTGDGDLQLLYGRLISPFIDLQAGVRYEQQLSWDNGLGRGFAVIGVKGLVPYGMELDASIFLSQSGDLSARVTLAQDFLLTQQLILQPRVELNAALQSAARYGVGAGVNDIEAGLRLRYEFRREFAPYVGVSWLQSLGETAALRSAGGENTSAFQLVAGVRLWF